MKKIYHNYLLTIGLAGLVVCFAIGIYCMHTHAVVFQQNAIGALYLKNEEMSEDYLHALFGEISEENIEASGEAFHKFGFTDMGASYLEEKMGILKIGIWFIVLELLLLGFVSYLLYQKDMLWKKKKAVMEARILELGQTRMQEDYVYEQNRRIQTFIENMAHQIKTPISRVFSALYMIEDGIEDAKKRERINECYSHLESVNALMKRLMDIGRLEAGKIIFKKEKIGLEELMEDVIRSCTNDTEKINTVFQAEGGVQFYGDYELLKEAFVNIVKNALEHDKSGKPLEIVCRMNHEQMKVSVRDHGPGLSEKDIPNLFDRFYLPEKVKTTHTGIGLNLAKLIFEGHFGSVYVYNHAEGGAVFNVILPMYSLKIRVM